MQIVIPERLPDYLKKAVSEAIPLAKNFLFSKYGEDIFNDLHVRIRSNVRRGKYYCNQTHPHAMFSMQPVAQIATGNGRLYLYEKKTLGKYKQGLSIGYAADIACCIVHECTHHVQFKRDGLTKKGRVKGGELETTSNEIEFLKINYPEWHKLLIQ